jgi:hypothetical protein
MGMKKNGKYEMIEYKGNIDRDRKKILMMWIEMEL